MNTRIDGSTMELLLHVGTIADSGLFLRIEKRVIEFRCTLYNSSCGFFLVFSIFGHLSKYQNQKFAVHLFWNCFQLLECNIFDLSEKKGRWCGRMVGGTVRIYPRISLLFFHWNICYHFYQRGKSLSSTVRNQPTNHLRMTWRKQKKFARKKLI